MDNEFAQEAKTALGDRIDPNYIGVTCEGEVCCFALFLVIKSLYLKGYIAKRLTGKFPEKSWIKRGVNKLLKKLCDTGTLDRWPGSGRPSSAHTEESNYAFVCLNIANILLTHKYTQCTQLHA